MPGTPAGLLLGGGLKSGARPGHPGNVSCVLHEGCFVEEAEGQLYCHHALWTSLELGEEE